MPRPLAADVPRGAANVAAARRLRNMVHGTVALDTGSQDGSQRGPQENMAEFRRRHAADGMRGEQSRGYRLASTLASRGGAVTLRQQPRLAQS